MSSSVHGTFVSEKISKIRWKPGSFNKMSDSQNYVSGTWDNNKNNIKLWSCYTHEHDSDLFPQILKTIRIEGDVTEMQFLNGDHFVVASSSGSVHLIKISADISDCLDLTEEYVWKDLHKFECGTPSPCTSLASYDNDFVTIGEDGQINLLTAQKSQPIHCIEEADSCTLNCVTFLKFNEILTGNLRGQMKIWDIRSHGNQPTSTFMLSGDQVAATCLTYHPTQRHIVVAGDEEGSLTVWDLRQNTFPVTLLSAHSDSVSEIRFHADHPDQLFSCSSSGEVWHWNTVGSSKLMLHNLDQSQSSPWMANENVKNKLQVFSLMNKLHKPVNSIDVLGDKVLVACDNEAFYIINNVNVTN